MLWSSTLKTFLLFLSDQTFVSKYNLFEKRCFHAFTVAFWSVLPDCVPLMSFLFFVCGGDSFFFSFLVIFRGQFWSHWKLCSGLTYWIYVYCAPYWEQGSMYHRQKVVEQSFWKKIVCSWKCEVCSILITSWSYSWPLVIAHISCGLPLHEAWHCTSLHI